MRVVPVAIVLSIAAAATPIVEAQEEIIRPENVDQSPRENQPAQDLIPEDFREREGKDRSGRIELVLGSLFLLAILLLAVNRRRRD